jgi:hypothetical protein
MTIDIQALILAADEAATAARSVAWKPVAPDQSEVDRVVAALPAKVAESLLNDPYASNFVLWEGYGATSRAMVFAILDAIGWPARDSVDRDGVRRVHVSLLDLAAAAKDIRVNRWINDVRTAWKCRGGTIDPRHDAATDGLEFATATNKGHITIDLDLDRSPAEVVEEAATALHLPMWTIDGLRDEWFERTVRTEAGLGGVKEAPGHYTPANIYRAVPCLIFMHGATEPFVVDLDAARAITATELCARAADALGLSVEFAPATAPTVTQEPAKVAPVVPARRVATDADPIQPDEMPVCSCHVPTPIEGTIPLCGACGRLTFDNLGQGER